MPGRFNFVSTGAAMAGGLEDFLVQEEARRRQAMLDEITATETRNRAEDRRRALDDRDYDRESLRAGRIAENSLPDEEFDDETSAMLGRQGFGHMIRKKTVQGDVQADGETEDTRDPNRTANLSRGGTKFHAARTAAEEKARLAREAQTEKAEQARIAAKEKAELEAEKDKRDAEQKAADRQLRADIARDSNSTRNAIAQSGADAKKNAADEKKADAEKAEQARVKSMRRTAASIQTEAARLFDPKTGTLTAEGSAITGGLRVPAWMAGMPGVSGGVSANGHAALKRLQGLLDVDLIREMKTQSKTGATGFGALSEKELSVLESAAAALQTYQSEGEFANALKDIYENAGLGLLDATPTGAGEIDEARRLIEQYRTTAPSGGASARPTARDIINRARGAR